MVAISLQEILWVAPPAGAWIETGIPSGFMVMIFWSRPLRARGLKLARAGALYDPGWVAPPAGAWIETG